MIISAEFKQRCRSVIELLAKELIDRATDELMSYFEGELTRHCLNLKPLDLSVNSDTEVDRLTKPVDLSVSCGNFVATLDKIVDQKTSETPIFPIKQEQLDQVVNLPNSVADEKKTETQKENVTTASSLNTTNVTSNSTPTNLNSSNVVIKEEILENTRSVENPKTPLPAENVKKPSTNDKPPPKSTENITLKETNSTESNVSLKRNAELTTTSEDSNKSDTPPTKKPKTEIATRPISKTNSISSALTKSAGPSKASFSTKAHSSSSKSEESSHDDDDHYEYDRWSTSNFHRIKVIEIQCYVKNCQVMCKSKAEHEKHLQIDHKNSFLPFNCLAEGCSKSFADKTEWKRHTLEVHRKNGILSWKCRYCVQRFGKPATQFKHYLINHESGTFACTCCHFTCNYRIELISHISSQHSASRNINSGGKSLVVQKQPKPQLNRFEFSWMNIVSIGCLHCPGWFASEDEYTHHLKGVHNFEMFPCYLEGCQMSFQAPEVLEKHMKSAHDLSHCHFCSEPLSNMFKNSLKLHTLFHHQRGQFRCTYCHLQPTFSTRAEFKQHFNLVHKCPFSQCSSYLEGRENWIQHFQAVHSISEFMCFFNNCHRNFSTEALLENHLAQAHRVKSWQCPYCPVGYIPTHRELCAHINQNHLNGIFSSAYQTINFPKRLGDSSY